MILSSITVGIILGIVFAGIALLLLRSRDKRIKNMILNKNDDVVVLTSRGTLKGKVVEDCGDKVKIEIEVYKQLVYKN